MKVYCYSKEKGTHLLELCSGYVDGARVNSCHPYWYRACKARGECSRFFSAGTFWRDKELAKLLKKPVSKLTDKDRYERADEFRRKGFRACKKIKVTVCY